MKETLSSIAARLGVSTTTVSRVLGGKADKYRISQEMIDRVEAEARRCGYMSQFLAQKLRKVRTHTIGLVLPSITNPFFADIASAIITKAQEKGYTTIIVDSMENEENQRDVLSTLVSRKVDGIIAAPCGTDAAIFEEVRKSIPLVLVDRYFENSRIPYVTSNNYKGAFEAVEMLLQSGHREIACIQGEKESSPNKARVQGYRDALRMYGLEEKCRISGEAFSIQNGYLETKLLLNRSPRPTAIFALSYTIVLGALRAINDSEYRIPEDISIISFDDHTTLDYTSPAISRVSQPVAEMGGLAAKILFDYIENGNENITQLKLSTTLVSGASVLSREDVASAED